MKETRPSRCLPIPRATERLPAILTALALLSAAGRPMAQDGARPAERPASAVTIADVRQAVASGESADLSDEIRKALQAAATEAEASLSAEEQARTAAGTFRKQIAALPAEMAALRAATAEAPDPSGPPLAIPPDGNTGDVLEVALAASQEEVENARQELARLGALPESRENRRKELNALLATLARQESDAGGAAPSASASSPELSRVRSLAAAAAGQARKSRQDAAQAELALYDAEAGTGAVALREQAAAATLARLQKRHESLQARANAARADAATDAVREAESRESSAPAELRPELAAVTRLAAENRHVVEVLIPAANKRLESTEEQVARWTETASRTRERIRRLQSSGILGVELRRQLLDLPAEATLRAGADRRRDELVSVEATRLALEEELAGLPAEKAPGRDDSPDKARRGILNELLLNYGRYFNLLVRLNESAGQLQATVGAQRAFVYEQILWMPSAPPADAGNLPALTASLRWLRDGLTDGTLPREWLAGVRRSPWDRAVLPLLAAAAIFLFRRKAKSGLAREAEEAARPDATFAPTARALFLTLLLALPWPFLIWAAARPLLSSGDAFALAWAEGMTLSALALLALEFFRQVLRPAGLAEAHFHWNRQQLAPVRRQVRLGILVAIPALWIGSTFGHAFSMRHDSAWRLCLLVLLGVMAWWLHRFLNAGRAGRLAEPGKADERRGSVRLAWWLGHVLGVAVPVALAVLALCGYLYTAEVLTGRLALSLLAVGLMLLVRELFFRWYRLHRARLRSARARQLREAREASRSEASRESDSGSIAAPGAGNDLAVEVAKDEFRGQDIDGIGEEMRQLVGIVLFLLVASALWLIWADVMPAAQRLAAPSEPPAAAVAPDSAPGPVSSALPIPMAPAASASTAWSGTRGQVGILNFLLAAAAAVVTWMAALRIPGALQFILSSRISLDSGMRFALSTITRYAIVIAGTVFALKSIGLSWSNVQWLAAALTVGLGFGLQEIFANFFSGLILLFERPIRPGDVVTIDNITGTVTRIRIRATTIRTADYTEYIVPNREFITGKLLNWTLTDTISRMTVQVGVGPDTDLPGALAILRKIADEHPHVRKDPAPSVACEGFSDTSITLVLRYYLSILDHRLSSLSEIHCRIAAEFAEAGIEVPFPRRELHLIGASAPGAGASSAS